MYHLPSKGEESEQKDDTRRTSQICSWVQEGKVSSYNYMKTPMAAKT